MNIRFHRKLGGNILLVCLFTTAALGVVLVGYLQLGQSNEKFTARSQAWNLALPVAEAGVEEALTQLNNTKINGASLVSNGWSKNGGGGNSSGKGNGKGNGNGNGNAAYIRSRTVSPESYYDVGIDVSGTKNKDATITSTGFVRAPNATNYISRTVTGTFSRTNFIFAKAIIAKKHIRIGKGSLVDSFDSTSSTYSTKGAYDATKRKAGGSVATVSEKKNGIKIEDTKVYGDASVADGGNVEFKGNGTLGDPTWVNAGNKGAQTGTISTGYQYDFAPIKAPWTSGGVPPSGGKLGTTNYQYILGTGNWELGKVDLQAPMIVTGNAVLYVTGDFKASENIVINSAANLTLYMAGSKFEITDKNITLNGGNATQFQYYGLPSNKTFKFKKHDAAFTGIVYAPNAKVMIDGNSDVIGSIIGKCVHLKHAGEMHFDEGINSRGTEADVYALKTWSE